MIKYAKIIDEELGTVNVGLDDNEEAIELYKSMGFSELDVQQSDINYQWYLTEMCPMKTEEQKEQEERERISKLFMTKQDFFNFVLKPQGLSYSQLMAIVNSDETYQVAWNLCNNVYRGDQNLVGALKIYLPKLTDEELDRLFEEYGN